jgi:peptidoglycan/LPS O-acetylase OafA/YrhL
MGMIAEAPSLPDVTVRKFGLPHGSASVHLDALRGLAAISVMFYHWWDACFASYDTVPHQSPLLKAAYNYGGFGHAWVIVFFVLSGYLVGGSVLRARENKNWSWRTYLLNRCTRIYVVLTPALLLGGALDWAGMHQPGAEIIYSGKSGMGSLYYSAYSSLTAKVFWENVFFLDIHTIGFGSNAPLWSLSHEFWYYLVFPFLVFALERGGRSQVRFASWIAVLAWVAFVGGYKLALYPVWLAGVLIFFLPPFPVHRSWGRRLAIVSSLVLLLIGFVLRSRDMLFPDHSFTLGRSHWHPPISDVLLSPIVVLLIWIIICCATGPLPTAYIWLAKRAAASSYTIYLVHQPALVFLKAYLHLPRAVPSWQTFPARLALFAIVLVYAQIVYWLFERNTDGVRRWINRLPVLGRPRA